MPDDKKKRIRDVKTGALVAAAVSSFLLLNSCSSEYGVPPRSVEDEQKERQENRSHVGYSGSGHLYGTTGSQSRPSTTEHQGNQTVRGGFGKTASHHGASGFTG